MTLSSEHNIPWELIISHLQGDLSREEELQFHEWISASDTNKELFDRIRRIWTEDITDYNAYQAADEKGAWTALRFKMKTGGSREDGDAKIVEGNFRSARMAVIRWVSVAAVLVIIAGSFIWYNLKNQGTPYETGIAQERSIELTDGSSIKLYANSKIVVNRDYNNSERVIKFERGVAFFEVIHNETVPFRVEMQKATVMDIGTSFYINNTKDSISVSVKTGEVSFTDKQNNETKQLTAGMILKYVMADKSAAGSISIDSTEAIAGKTLLRFHETPLSEVMLRFEKWYGKKLILDDSTLSQRPFTGNLERLEFVEAINILSKSLNIQYSIENDVYHLK